MFKFLLFSSLFFTFLLGCDGKSVDSTPYVETDLNGNVLSGDTMLQYFRYYGIDSVSNDAWKNYIGFVPKKGCQNKIKLKLGPNPTSKYQELTMNISSEIEIIGVLAPEGNSNSLGYDPIANKKEFDIKILSNPNGEPSKYYSIILVTKDSCVLHNSYYVKRY